VSDAARPCRGRRSQPRNTYDQCLGTSVQLRPSVAWHRLECLVCVFQVNVNLESERHVLTIEDLPVIREVLNALSAGAGANSNGSAQTRQRLKEFAKQGCEALILNMRVVEESLEDKLPEIKGASLVGGVLVVACVVTSTWILQVEELSRRHFFPKTPVFSFGSFVRGLF
jgi:hypothetical protein